MLLYLWNSLGKKTGVGAHSLLQDIFPTPGSNLNLPWILYNSAIREENIYILKLNIQKIKIMAFGPVTSWQIDEETMEIVRDFILGGGLQNP